MNVGQLKKLLAKYPDNLDIWFSPDIGIGEGGVKLNKVKLTDAYNAGLDGDEVNDEYFYTDDLEGHEIDELKKKGLHSVKGVPGVISKNILILE